LELAYSYGFPGLDIGMGFYQLGGGSCTMGSLPMVRWRTLNFTPMSLPPELFRRAVTYLNVQPQFPEIRPTGHILLTVVHNDIVLV